MVSSFVFRETEPPQLQMRTIVNVEAGLELSNSYIDTGRCTADRRAELLSSYCFSCSCAACKSGARHDASASQYAEVAAAGLRVQQLIDEQRFEEAALTLKSALPAYEKALFAKSPNLGIQLYKCCKLLEYCEKDLQLAADCRRKAEEILSVVFGEDDALVKEIKARF